MKKNDSLIILLTLIVSAAMLLLVSCKPRHEAVEQGDGVSAKITDQPVSSSEEPDQTPTHEEPTEAPADEPDKAIGREAHIFSYMPCPPIEDFVIEPVQYEDESKKGDERTIEFAGKKYEVRYVETIEHPMRNGRTLDTYQQVGNIIDEYSGEPMTVEILPDGSIYKIGFGFLTSIDIKACSSGEDIRKAVEEALKDEIDFSVFNNFAITEADKSYDLSMHSLFWNIKRGGLESLDGLIVYVDQQGTIKAIISPEKSSLEFGDIPDTLNPRDYYPLIEQKVKDVFGEYLISYEHYDEYSGGSRLALYNDVPCISFKVSVHFKYLEYEKLVETADVFTVFVELKLP